VGPMPSKDEPCTFTLPLDLAAEDLVLDVWNTKHITTLFHIKFNRNLNVL
jgi:hypothetical protein